VLIGGSVVCARPHVEVKGVNARRIPKTSYSMISRESALELVRNTSKYMHALAVSAIMRKLAVRLDEDSKEWELVGLLHDLDIDEARGDMSKHGVMASERLRGKLPKHCLCAIKAHDYRTGFKPASKLDEALIASDSLAVLIEKIRNGNKELNVDTLGSELEEISLKQPWHKTNILRCEEIGLNLAEFLMLGITSLRSIKWLTSQPRER
jgi:predicted hydrolase (HD superfamily)